jgi:hypothetical protein
LISGVAWFLQPRKVPGAPPFVSINSAPVVSRAARSASVLLQRTQA